MKEVREVMKAMCETGLELFLPGDLSEIKEAQHKEALAEAEFLQCIRNTEAVRRKVLKRVVDRVPSDVPNYGGKFTKYGGK